MAMMFRLRCIPLLILLMSPALARETFESFAPQPLRELATERGRIRADDGHAEIIRGKGRSSNQCLKILGGEARCMEWHRDSAWKQTSTVEFWAERWTRADPFAFHVEAQRGKNWEKVGVHNDIVIGGFLTKVRFSLPAGVSALRLVCTSKAGMLVDDLHWNPDAPMHVTGVKGLTPVIPIMKRAHDQAVMGFSVESEGSLNPPTMEAVTLTIDEPTRIENIESIALVRGGSEPDGRWQETLATSRDVKHQMTLRTKHQLISEEGHFWLVVNLQPGASIDKRIGLSIQNVVISGKTFSLAETSSVSQRIGVAVRKRGDDDSKFYRIPGLARSKKGTLLAVYDVRYHHAGDLPADIDIGISRSTDGGQTWGPMIIAINQGKDPKHGYDGVGDPAILCDETTGRLWIAGLWSHGNRAWNGSGPGLKPEETGQLLLAYSDDDGVTWSKPRNITNDVKQPEWRLLLNGPGAGICMRDGTLVFTAQYRAADGPPHQGKPFSTILWSKDRGVTWQLGTGVKIDTTEAQVAELPDGSLMLNCRDNRGGSRTVMVTHDLGKTWTPHATDRSALREPVCMASLLRWTNTDGKNYYVFSNPNSTQSRHHMTIKVSSDAAMTWPDTSHTLYDQRAGFGYSCLAPVDAQHIGVLYESAGDILFLKLPFAELLGK
jgi:sialidase-1